MRTAPTPRSSSAAEKAWSSFSSASTKPSTKHSPSASLRIRSIASKCCLHFMLVNAAYFGRLPNTSAYPFFRDNGSSLISQRRHGIDPRCLPSRFKSGSYSDGYEYACGAGHSCRVIRAQSEEQTAERVNAEKRDCVPGKQSGTH